MTYTPGLAEMVQAEIKKGKLTERDQKHYTLFLEILQSLSPESAKYFPAIATIIQLEKIQFVIRDLLKEREVE